MPTDTLVDTTSDSSTSRSSNLVLVGSDAHEDVETTTSPSQRVDDLSRLLLEFRLTSEQKAEKDEKLIKRIGKQVFWLKTALFLALIALGGSLMFSNQSLKSQQAELAATVATLSDQEGPAGSLVTRLDALEKQAAQIETSVPKDLSNTLEAAQTQLDELTGSVSQLETNLDQRKSVTAVLANALQSLVEDPSVTDIPAVSSDSSNSNEIAPTPSTEPDDQPDAAPADSPENN